MPRKGEFGLKSYFDVLSILVTGGLPEEGPADDAEGVEFPENLIGHHTGNGGEKDKLVVLVQVAQEVVYARSLRHAPSVLTAPLTVDEQVFETDDQGVRLSHVGVLIREQLRERWVLVVAGEVAHTGFNTVVPEA